MPITGDDADRIARFRESSDRERLRLARDMAVAPDLPSKAVLKAMLADEDLPWVRNAIESALGRLGEGAAKTAVAGELDEADELYAQALHVATREILHEVSPIVGRARLAARQLLADQPRDNALERELQALGRTVEALRRLSAASAVPVPAEFDLAGCVSDLTRGLASETQCNVRASGPSQYFVVADRALVELVITNLVRNAIEATDALLSEDISGHEVIVNWGTRANQHWVSVIDRGEGLPAQAAELFERGVTLRDRGSGLGLTTATRAASSVGGTLELAPNDQGGTTATFRWPAEGSE